MGVRDSNTESVIHPGSPPPPSRSFSSPNETTPKQATRLRVVSPPFFLKDSRASETRARVKITPREKRRHATEIFSLSPPRVAYATTRSLQQATMHRFPFFPVSGAGGRTTRGHCGGKDISPWGFLPAAQVPPRRPPSSMVLISRF